MPAVAKGRSLPLQAAVVAPMDLRSLGVARPPRQGLRGFAVVVQNCPPLGGESITDGTVMEWKKKVGDAVKKNDLLCVIETDKVTIDVKAETDGVLQEIVVKNEETIEIGKPLAKISSDASAAATAAPAKPQVAAAAAPAAAAPAAPAAAAPAAASRVIEQTCGDFGAESITEGTIMEWRKSVGDFVEKNEVVGVIETDKVSIDIKAEEAGTLTEILAKADDTVRVGQSLMKLTTGGAPSVSAATVSSPVAEAAVPAAAVTAPLVGLRATFARIAAKRLGLPDPTVVAPTVPAPAAATPAPAPVAPVAVAPVVPNAGSYTVPISFIRQRVIERMQDTQNRAAVLSTFQEADMSAALELRSKYKDAFLKRNGVPLGLLSLYVKASALALQEEPGVNAFIDDEAKEIVYRDYVDLSVPIPSPRGNISCVLRDVQAMSVVDIERKLAGFMERARSDTLNVEDMGSSTFGIIDTGAVGGMMGTTFINPPQSAVLGTNAVKKRAVVASGKVEARPMMYMSLTYDHRLVDGREAVTFLCSVRDKLEDPSRMLVGL
eukprot:TRINITY_DN76448_c0_g1_i1.p1 TRINITY_DN76448_c0_g1~~TRINITY_DN76448_c0_g1_i1.p1  ORF type:complete len:618 (-),score=158.05 TRINITY_DN76448_c0_g1_i1:81-1727(-)